MHSLLQICSASYASHRLLPSHVESKALMFANSQASFDSPTPSTHILFCNMEKAHATDTDIAYPGLKAENQQNIWLEV